MCKSMRTRIQDKAARPDRALREGGYKGRSFRRPLPRITKPATVDWLCLLGKPARARIDTARGRRDDEGE